MALRMVWKIIDVDVDGLNAAVVVDLVVVLFFFLNMVANF